MPSLKNMENANGDLVNKVEVLFENEECAVLNKPSGLMVHPAQKSTEKTLCDFILEKWPQTKDVGEPLILQDGSTISRPGIVHRLDRETSGVLVVAKTAEAHAHLKKQFQKRSVRKTYRAFVYGKVLKEVGSVNLPLGRSKGDFRQYTQPAKARGEMREALTYYTTLSAKKDFSYLELVPKTGRTHQIRAHMKAISHPVVCDRLYAKSKPCSLGFDRVALHAFRLEFRAFNGDQMKVEAPLPRDFLEAESIYAKL